MLAEHLVLGFIIDTKLTFNSHIQALVQQTALKSQPVC